MKWFLIGWSFLASLLPQISQTPPTSFSFAVGGDMLFDRQIVISYPGNNLYQVLTPLKNVVFNNVDLALVNLEGPISATTPPADLNPHRMTFRFPPQTVAALKYLGINAVSLANNHTHNTGFKGLADTRKLLNTENITPIGGPYSQDIYEIATFSGNRRHLVVIAVNTFSQHQDITSLIKTIKTDKNSRVLIFPHWGEEYQIQPSKHQQTLAHSWIDAGADIVIGSHPHVIQSPEVYKNRPIIYSLGNLLFDQDFSEATQIGLIINGTFTDQGLQLSAVPIKSIKFQPTPLSGIAKDNILETFYRPFSNFLQQTTESRVAFFPD